jgi:NACHT domain.
MAIDAGDALVRSLTEHNPWWEDGVDAFSLPARAKSDFYPLARPEESDSRVDDHQLLAIVGRRGVGKTTLLHQFIHHRIEAGLDPERFLYLPFDADPLYQLQSDEQLQRAVRYYESRILGRIDSNEPHFIVIDDINQIEHPNKPTIDGWGTAIGDMIADTPGRHLLVTASAGVQIERALESVDISDAEYAIQPILPEKFRDYLFSLYPELEDDDTRVSPSSLRSGEQSLPTAVQTGNVEPLIENLRAKYDRVADLERRIQSQVVEFLAMGGTLSYDLDGPTASASEISSSDYTRMRNDVRNALYQEVPGF